MKKLAFSILLLLISFCSFAQRFEGGLAGGFNFTQLDGDLLSGYNKLGLNGGFWVSYPFNDKWSGGIEFFFTQKGASRSINEENIASTRTFDRFRLNYFEVPLYAAYTYKKFTFQGGITGGYLLSANIEDFTGKRDYKNQLKPFETGTLFGVSYPINKKLSAQLRYQYSIVSIAKGDNNNILIDNSLSNIILGLYNNLFMVSIKYSLKK